MSIHSSSHSATNPLLSSPALASLPFPFPPLASSPFAPHVLSPAPTFGCSPHLGSSTKRAASLLLVALPSPVC